jgi:hypothetical protein
MPQPASRDPADRAAPETVPPPSRDGQTDDARAFRDSFGEELLRAIDVATWHTGFDLAREYPRIEREVRQAIRDETALQRRIRAHVFPWLVAHGGAVCDARPDVIAAIHRGLLFGGGVEACDGTMQVHDTLPLTIYQVGVSLVSYHGDQGTWHQRLFRRDLRQQLADPVAALLEQRSRRAALNHDARDDRLGELARKTIMDYAERAILRHRSNAVWRMGHGNPITYELLTGGGILELMVAATQVLRDLIVGHRKFVFVASEPRERVLLTIGQALHPLQYALVQPLNEMMGHWLHQKRFTVDTAARLPWAEGEWISPAEWIPRVLDEIASQVVVGVYRASAFAPAHLFYAHRAHAHYAAHVVLADSLLQEQRGFPLLIDLADHVCTGVFGRSLSHLTEAAYAHAGAPGRYFSERQTRQR